MKQLKNAKYFLLFNVQCVYLSSLRLLGIVTLTPFSILHWIPFMLPFSSGDSTNRKESR